MGYLHITNLYNEPGALECYALEKIHGTSAHVAYRKGNLHFYAGGMPDAGFKALFDPVALTTILSETFKENDDLTVFGEAFGGKLQGMSDTYGKATRFLAFDVRLNGVWLDVPSAENVAKSLNIGFVPYERGPLQLDWLNEQRDRDALTAVVPGKMREGIVIRGIKELNHKDGSRFIYKHKRQEFRETKTVREVDPARALVLTGAAAIAEEYVTPMRLEHVLQRVPYNSARDTGAVIAAMAEDVMREGELESIWTKDIARAVSTATVKLLTQMPSAIR